MWKTKNTNNEKTKRNQIEILELKSTITKMITIQGLKESYEQAKESISEPEDRKWKLSHLRNRKKRLSEERA